MRHKSSTEKNLLLSRLPIEPEIMDSIATDTDQEIKEMDLEAAGSVRSSLPLNIERQFNYFRLVKFKYSEKAIKIWLIFHFLFFIT